MTEWESKVSPQFIRECFSLNEDGSLVWKVRPASHFTTPGWHGTFNTRYANKPAGSRRLNSWRVCMMLHGVRRHLLVHRVVWVLVHGEWPKNFIDHINGDPFDNRPSNLRDVTAHGNAMNRRKPNPNNRSGFLGVRQQGSRYLAQIRSNGRTRYLGSFGTPEEAHEAYVAARTELMQQAGLTYLRPSAKEQQ